MTFVLLQLLFLANLSSLYAVEYKSTSKVHALKVLMVNFDTSGTAVQDSVLAAYSELQAESFNEVQVRTLAEYPTPQSMREAVCTGQYWAAIYPNDGASQRLNAALAGGDAAASYSTTPALSLVINSAKYPAITAGDVVGNMQTLLGVANAAYSAVNPTAVSTLNTSSAAAVSIFRNPFAFATIDIQPTSQGDRVFYNDILIVMPIVQQFLYIMGLNGLSTHFKLYSRLAVVHSLILRTVISTSYTFISSLCQAGLVWAFKESWSVNSNQFALTWMVLWLYAFVNFAVIDTATAFIPISFVAFFFLTWVIQNVGSALNPYELTAGWFRWTYALPGRNAYDLLVEVWSGGCEKVVNRALPVLVVYAAVFVVAANLGMWHRCKLAVEAEREALDEAAVLLDWQFGKQMSASSAGDGGPEDRYDVTEEEMLERQKLNIGAGMGPSFRMPFADEAENLV